jgi:signal peptidase I
MAHNKAAIHRFLNITVLTLLFLLMFTSSAIYLAPHLGWRVDGLRSGSMAPYMNTGDMVVTRPVSAETVQVNDVIIFRSPDKQQYMISHRVIGIETSPLLAFHTKGDANASPDPFTVPAGDLVGKLAFHIPRLGYGVLFLQTQSGLFVSLVIPGMCLVVWCLKSLRSELAARGKHAV